MDRLATERVLAGTRAMHGPFIAHQLALLGSQALLSSPLSQGSVTISARVR
jgi:hypothetical protein